MNEIGLAIILIVMTGVLIGLVAQSYKILEFIDRLITASHAIADKTHDLRTGYDGNVELMRTISARMVDAQAAFNEAARKLKPVETIKPAVKPTKKAAKK